MPPPHSQVTNDDTRVVSLADPVTGEVVARMVMGPASAELREQAAAAGVLHPHAAAAAEAQEDVDEPGPSSCLLLVLYVLAWVGLLVTIPFSMAADAGGHGGSPGRLVWAVAVCSHAPQLLACALRPLRTSVCSSRCCAQLCASPDCLASSAGPLQKLK